jgi:hypothetical protein
VSYRGLVKKGNMDALKFSDQRYMIFDAAAVRAQTNYRGYRARKQYYELRL